MNDVGQTVMLLMNGLQVAGYAMLFTERNWKVITPGR
jgi:hypothetical protein